MLGDNTKKLNKCCASERQRLREKIDELKREVPQRPLIQKGGEFERRDDIKYQERCMVYMAQSSYNRAFSDILKLLNN